MKKLITIPILLFSLLTLSQVKPDTLLTQRITNVEKQLNEIEKLKNEVESLKDKLEFQQRLNEQTINSVSNQLDSASYNLTLFGILFTIAAVLLAFYVTYIERKIVRINEENKDLLVKNQKIKQDIEEINTLIQSDIYNLFLKIKREETVHILDRLVKIPQDIVNVAYSLLSRELIPDDFAKLKQAYLNLTDDDGKNTYHILFFQHFFNLALKDEEVRRGILNYIPNCVTSSFENDIVKSTKDLATILVDKGINEYKMELDKFSQGIVKSNYKNFDKIYNELFETLKTRKNRFDLFTSIESRPDTRLVKINFGRLLVNEYSNQNPTESESLVFKEVEDLKVAQQKEEEEKKLKEEEKAKQQEEKKQQQLERLKLAEEKKKAAEGEKKV